MSTPSHAALMDQVYRRQRHIYDATRKYYLLGRDALIEDLAPRPGARVLEIGCGTGRNLVKAARRYPQASFSGIDISEQMLEMSARKIARHGLGERVRIAQADATDFSPRRTFGADGFDRVYFSYTLSMVPDWRAALMQALNATHHDGQLHIIDFGQLEGFPRPARAGLRKWLALFHVDPQADMADGVRETAALHKRPARFTRKYRDYSWAFMVGPADPPG